MAIDIHILLAEALLELCDQKSVTSITIKDLLEETGVSRQTFYNRFRDKNDLIQWTYEHKVLNIFLNNNPENTYYKNTLSYYKNIDAHRNFLKQACSSREQNCLMDFIVKFAIDYDLKWHQQHYGNKSLPKELIFASKYHSVASINAAIEWICSDNPEPAKVMAKRITNLRKISLSDVLFGPDNKIYSCEDADNEK
ncbi:TetR/AcrR family transcriptional regulator C-terminal domain-containing protein [Clostridium estertheticum]|uniref:TetR family transcriptional regulator n=1 Tax=Clostridium estertheticum TaxID=238834 RepID=A0A7Y3SZ02_9CLOT|nr:TetR/AcrR family transcriptional regulator C-terminal domain-containing protein [Clostridium estertheticum]MBU3214722.1 TetR/AcrR family transcriptional regulator [Clostridium estertheticum]MCB2354611.1 TetR/AcrR family transcriptional regulator [Clostridium estertheticum]MCB2358536.1 TetR/AcrR family transcriptional regulator [Clostridium estertheticum]NNU77650.1 TetR family transcriptional regulator [Clostridium estertheticum]WAG40859.1 TetR/AcrR family transcriptional regulator [Clostrid